MEECVRPGRAPASPRARAGLGARGQGAGGQLAVGSARIAGGTASQEGRAGIGRREFALRKEKGEADSRFDISKLCYVFGQ